MGKISLQKYLDGKTSLSEFSPKLLNFIYELSKLDTYKSSIELANSIRLDRVGSVTPKTIRNWFKYLRGSYTYMGYHIEERLSYFPGFFKSKLGLNVLTVFYEEPSEDIIHLFPIRDFLGWLYDPQSNQQVLMADYVVPVENTDEFLGLINKVRERGLCSNLSVYSTKPSYRMTAPLHRVIDGNGVFHPAKIDPREVRQKVESLFAFLQTDMTPELSSAVRRNPLIIPVLVEYEYEHRSSTEVWSEIKRKLKDSVWDYTRRYRKKTEGVGIKKVQTILRDLKKLGLLTQMRIVYFPLEIGRNMWLYTVFNFKTKGDLIRMAETMMANSIYSNVFPISDTKARFASLVNGESLQNLFEPLSLADVEKLYFFDYSKSMHLATTTQYLSFDYAQLFNPERCSWSYNHDMMTTELDRLS